MQNAQKNSFRTNYPFCLSIFKATDCSRKPCPHTCKHKGSFFNSMFEEQHFLTTHLLFAFFAAEQLLPWNSASSLQSTNPPPNSQVSPSSLPSLQLVFGPITAYQLLYITFTCLLRTRAPLKRRSIWHMGMRKKMVTIITQVEVAFKAAILWDSAPIKMVEFLCEPLYKRRPFNGPKQVSLGSDFFFTTRLWDGSSHWSLWR